MGKYQGDSGHTLVEDWEQLIAVMMIQQPNEFTDYWRLFRNLVYQAIVA